MQYSCAMLLSRQIGPAKRCGINGRLISPLRSAIFRPGDGADGVAKEQSAPAPLLAGEISGRPLRDYDLVMAAFVVVLLLSQVIGAAKVASVALPGLGPVAFGAGILFFPVSYVIGDVLTEVYGYARARRCIWVGFAGMLYLALMSWVVVALPPSAGWTGQAAYEAVFGQVPRIVFASICAFWAGEFVNSFVLARMKLWTGGRYLWTRTIGSTIFGEAVDSAIFYPLAFLGASGWTPGLVVRVMIVNWLMKVAWETLLTPFTYLVVNTLKRREGFDLFDRGTDFTPFRAAI